MRLPLEQQFHFPDGTSVASLDELRDKIETISYNTFYHHVDHSKNDFANWVRYILKDEWLANEMEKVNSIVETVELLNDYLHPKPARKHLEAQDDIQSRIEHKIGFEPADLAEPETPSEPAPQVAPEDVLSTEDLSEIVEPANQEKNEQIQERSSYNELPKFETPRVSTHLKRSAEERHELEEFHNDMHRLIVKDFIWGMLFGLVIGFILARMLGI